MVKRVAEFKDRLNEALSIRNIKPVELAEKLGVTEGTISQYRKGTTKAKSDRLYEIALILDVNPVWLMGVDVPMDEEERAKKIREDYINDDLSSDDRELLDLYHIASPEARAMVDFALKRNQQKP